MCKREIKYSAHGAATANLFVCSREIATSRVISTKVSPKTRKMMTRGTEMPPKSEL